MNIDFAPWDLKVCTHHLVHCTVHLSYLLVIFTCHIHLSYLLDIGHSLVAYMLSCFHLFFITGDPGEALPVSCEEDIFDYIDFPYKEPSQRNL